MQLFLRGLLSSGGVLFAIFLNISCQNFSFKIFDSDTKDSSLAEVEIKENYYKKPLILDKWDSLRRNQMVFEVDSVHPVSVKQQKRQLRDSLKAEFEKQSKHVYLTFDDGPLVGSFAIDSLARAKNVKLNTFLVGKHAKMGKGRQRDLERYKDNPLISCYNHSYSHANNKFTTFYSNVNASFDDFVKNQSELALDKKIARLPGRNIWIYDDVRRIDLNSGAQTADSLNANGYKVFGWDVEWRINSITGIPVQSLANTIYNIRYHMNNPSKAQTPNNVVLLMHDDMFQTKKGRQLLADLIDSLKNDNYHFEFMEDYPIKH